MSATIAPKADQTKGISKTGHNGGLFLFGRSFSLSVSSGEFVGGRLGGRRNIVSERRVVRNAAIEQRKKVPPIRIRVQ
jgi:hypothetical protein